MNLSLARVKKELVCPYYRTSRKILDFLHNRIRPWEPKLSRNKKNPILIWDIRSNAITFDFLWLVFDAANRFARLGHTKMDCIIYWPEGYRPHPFIWNSYHKYVSADDLAGRMERIILPLAHLFECIDTLHLRRTEQEVLAELADRPGSFPKNYHPKYYYPPALDYFRAYGILWHGQQPHIPKIIVTNETGSQKLHEPYVTLTLRDYGFIPMRNTTQRDVDVFCCFARNLKARPVIVPDDLDQLKGYVFPPDVLVYPPARLDIKERICLYNRSLVNLFPPSGPFSLSLFIPNTKSIMFNMGKGGKDCDPSFTKKYYGYSTGDQPFRRLNGHIIWYRHHPKQTSEDFLQAYKSLT